MGRLLTVLLCIVLGTSAFADEQPKLLLQITSMSHMPEEAFTIVSEASGDDFDSSINEICVLEVPPESMEALEQEAIRGVPMTEFSSDSVIAKIYANQTEVFALNGWRQIRLRGKTFEVDGGFYERFESIFRGAFHASSCDA